MKYHYFHGRFTYSVKRSGPRAVVLPRGVDCLVRLDSCVEACAVLTGFGRSGRFLAGLGGSFGALSRSLGPSRLFRLSGRSLFCEAIRAEDSVGWGV